MGVGAGTLVAIAALFLASRALPLAVLSGVLVARFAPLAESTRFMLGVTLVFPIWIAAMCLAFLARSAARVWCVCAALGAVLGALVYGAPY